MLRKKVLRSPLEKYDIPLSRLVSNKRQIIKQTCSSKLQVYLSMYAFLVDIRYLRVSFRFTKKDAAGNLYKNNFENKSYFNGDELFITKK